MQASHVRERSAKDEMDATVAVHPDEISPELFMPTMHMTRLTIAEDPGEEFALRAHNIVTDGYDDEVVFYNDVLKVQVLPERESFTVQIITPDFVVEMDFAVLIMFAMP
jgi:hypothetical protein